MKITELAQEYQKISLLIQISDAEAQRLEEILIAAESDPELNSLLNTIDFHVAKEQGLLDFENMIYLENQRIRLLKNIDNEIEERESCNDLANFVN